MRYVFESSMMILFTAHSKAESPREEYSHMVLIVRLTAAVQGIRFVTWSGGSTGSTEGVWCFCWMFLLSLNNFYGRVVPEMRDEEDIYLPKGDHT